MEFYIILSRWIFMAIIGTILYEFFIGKSGVKESIIWLFTNLLFAPLIILGQLHLWRSFYRNKAYSKNAFISDRDALHKSQAFMFIEAIYLLALLYTFIGSVNLWAIIFAILFIFSNFGYLLYSLSRYRIFILLGIVTNILVLIYAIAHL
nr:hypothetical protein [uncultured Cetobacterium sp.]